MKIAVSGKLGAGKNLFHDIAQELFPELKFEEGKFADLIYCIHYDIQSTLDLPAKKDGKLLQFLGKHFRDTISKSFWVDKFFEKEAYRDHKNLIITDVRFPEEFEECKKRGYVLIRINRTQELRDNNLGNRDINHESETALDHVPDSAFDYTINNNGSFQLFESAVISIIEELKRRKNE